MVAMIFNHTTGLVLLGFQCVSRNISVRVDAFILKFIQTGKN
jgi:hypothetical protein